MVEITELSEYEVAAILRGLRGEVVVINHDEAVMVRSLSLKLINAPPTLDTIRRMRRHQNTVKETKHGMRL